MQKILKRMLFILYSFVSFMFLGGAILCTLTLGSKDCNWYINISLWIGALITAATQKECLEYFTNLD